MRSSKRGVANAGKQLLGGVSFLMIKQDNVFKILFVCTGNICRSPTADAVLRHKIREAGLESRVFVDSAGTHGYHIGEPPDSRSMATALSRGGVDMKDLRARKISDKDFDDFDWIVAMDGGHHEILNRAKRENHKAQLYRFTAFLGRPDDHVPDPYYGGLEGFAQVYDLIEDGCSKIFDRICAETLKNNKFSA